MNVDEMLQTEPCWGMLPLFGTCLFGFVSDGVVTGVGAIRYRSYYHSFWHDDPTDPGMHERYKRRPGLNNCPCVRLLVSRAQVFWLS